MLRRRSKEEAYERPASSYDLSDIAYAYRLAENFPAAEFFATRAIKEAIKEHDRFGLIELQVQLSTIQLEQVSLDPEIAINGIKSADYAAFLLWFAGSALKTNQREY